jgi:hypothetical protein
MLTEAVLLLERLRRRLVLHCYRWGEVALKRAACLSRQVRGDQGKTRSFETVLRWTREAMARAAVSRMLACELNGALYGAQTWRDRILGLSVMHDSVEVV